MKRLSKVLSILFLAILVAAPPYAQNTGSLSGKVLGRDGMPAANIQVRIDQLYTDRGQIAIRDQQVVKTGKNGEYSLSGIQNGRVRIIVMENGQPVLTQGEKTGDEIYIANGLDKRIPTFDLSKAPAPVAGAAAGPDTGSKLTDAERKAMRDRLEKEAAAGAEADKAFAAGKAAYTEKNFEEAIKQFKMAAEKQPSQDVIWANLGKVYDSLATANQNKANREPDADAKAALNKEAVQNYVDCIAAYEKAVALKPLESAYYLNLSLAQLGAGKVEESKTTIEKAASLDPGKAGQAYYNLGATLINKGKYDEAVPALKKSIELDPTYGPAYFQLGLSAVGKGDAAGVEYLQKCLALANCPDKATAQGLVDALKGAAAQTYSSPDKAKSEPAKTQPAKNNSPAKGGKN